MIAGIAIDNWKLPIFKKHLGEAGFKYTQHPGLTKSTMLLKVTADWASQLQPVVQAANDECRAVNRNGDV